MLVGILQGVLDAICVQLEDGKEKVDWLDTFAFWIHEFGAKGDSERALALKDAARKFDRACGGVSRRLAQTHLERGETDWALRFAELRVWVCGRAGDHNDCVEACRFAEDMCARSADDAWRYLGRADFIRMRAHALARLRHEEEARAVYRELTEIFPAKPEIGRWPTMAEWRELEGLLEGVLAISEMGHFLNRTLWA